MFPLKSLVFWPLLFTWGFPSKALDETHWPNDVFLGDEEQHMIQKEIIDDSEIRSTALQIWNSLKDLNVQYDSETHKKNPRSPLASSEKPDDGYPSDEEHRSKKGQIIDVTADIDVTDISARIWNSRRHINVQYNNNPGKNTRLFQVGYADTVLSNLFQYYNESIGQLDPCQDQQRANNCQRDQTAFIEAISNEGGANGPIHELHRGLFQKGKFSVDYLAFKNELKRIWFTPYNRSRHILDSSGFEHVFLGELTGNGVTGFHNWMRMLTEEATQTHNFVALDANPCCKIDENIVASVQFQWHGSRPKWSSFFTKTSPATEIALYTLCFMTQPDNKCQVKLDNTTLRLQTYKMKNTAGLIGSAFPVFP